MKMPDASTTASGNPCPAARRGTLAARLTATLLLATICLLAVACAQEPPRQIALGAEVPVGPYAFEVRRARNTPNPPPPISTFRKQPGKKGIVAFVSWKTMDDVDGLNRLALAEKFLENQLSISDADGTRTPALGAMQERVMYMGDPGANWRDWVVVFFVPDQSRDLTLLVENPEPREGQASLIAVPLGL
jgi:hypothetical protein